LIVETPAGERMIPVVKEIVKEVDVERGRIVIDPPEGLLG
jgi:16S rRNA processing protein RimM